jgi:palmitoyltransferase ZDHHC13/17
MMGLDFSQLPSIPLINPKDEAMCLAYPTYCAISSTTDASFVFAVASWATLQLLWTILLLAGQLFQIMRQMTTFEVSNLGRFGFMGGRGESNVSMQQQGHQQDGLLAPEDDEALGGHTHSHGHSHGHGHSHNHGHNHGRGIAGRYSHKAAGCFGFILNVTGVDRFTRGKAANGMARSGKAQNPFDTGVVSNCVDFWTKGGEIGVQYEKLYDVPPDGFRAAVQRRTELRGSGDLEGGAADDNASLWSGGFGKKGAGSRFIPGFLGGGRGHSNSYRPVSMEEV